jgi:hypothetical protein
MNRRDNPADRIIPDEFLARYDTDDPARALELAQRQRTTTPTDQLPKCPECGTQRVHPKSYDGRTQSQAVDTQYVCYHRHHFDLEEAQGR